MEMIRMLKIESGTTNEAVKFVRNNIEMLGTLKSITHTRNMDSIYYKTVIKGSHNTIVLEGGLTSGYRGEGSNGLKKVLVMLGVDENIAEHYVFGNSDNEFEFTINF
jgi:hypothetical protein